MKCRLNALSTVAPIALLFAAHAYAQISISPSDREFTSDGGGGYILTTGTGEWQAVTAEDWIKISPRTNGVAEQPCIYVVRNNPSSDGRDGTIILNGISHKVIQHGSIAQSSPNPAMSLPSKEMPKPPSTASKLVTKDRLLTLQSTLDKFDDTKTRTSPLTSTKPSNTPTLSARSPMTQRSKLDPVEKGLKISLGLGYRFGEYTLSEGGQYKASNGAVSYYRKPSSELSSTQRMAAVLLDIDYVATTRWSLGGNLIKSLSSDAGKSTSLSWGDFYRAGYPGARSYTLDTKTISETEFDFLVYDMHVTYAFVSYDILQIGLRLGYNHQSYETELSNSRTTYPSSWSVNPPTYISGTWYSDEWSYSYPYLQLIGSIRFTDSFIMKAGLGGSPLAKYKSTAKNSSTDAKVDRDMDGTAVAGFAEASYKFGDDWYLTCIIEAMGGKADGQAKGYQSGRYIGSLENEIEMSHGHISLLIGKRF